MKNFDKDFEEAIRFIAEKFSSEKDLTKPTLFHSIRVGLYLYQNGCDKNTCLGGLLHDVLEDTETSESELEGKFGSEIAELVKINSKDRNISDKKIRSETIIKKCATHSLESAIIKAADILDNIRYYRRIYNKDNLETMITRASQLLKEKDNNFEDKVFSELNTELG